MHDPHARRTNSIKSKSFYRYGAQFSFIKMYNDYKYEPLLGVMDDSSCQWRNKIIETLSNLKTKPFDVVLFDTIRPLVSSFLFNTRKGRRLRDKNEKIGRSDSCRKAFEYFAFPGIIST